MAEPATVRLSLDDDSLDRLALLVARRLAERSAPSSPPTGWLDARAAAGYLGLPIGAVHRLTAARALTFAQDVPGGKCYFRAEDLDRWREGQLVEARATF